MSSTKAKMKTSDKISILEKYWEVLSPEDHTAFREEGKNSRLKKSAFNLQAFGTTGIGIITAFNIMPVFTAMDNLNHFQPANTPENIHVLPLNDPLATSVNAAIDAQTPPPIVYKLSDNGLFVADASAMAETKTPLTINAKKFNEDVKEDLSQTVTNNKIGLVLGTLTTIFSLTMASISLNGLRRSDKKIKTLYDKYEDTIKTQSPLLDIKNTFS